MVINSTRWQPLWSGWCKFWRHCHFKKRLFCRTHFLIQIWHYDCNDIWDCSRRLVFKHWSISIVGSCRCCQRLEQWAWSDKIHQYELSTCETGTRTLVRIPEPEGTLHTRLVFGSLILLNCWPWIQPLRESRLNLPEVKAESVNGSDLPSGGGETGLDCLVL